MSISKQRNAVGILWHKEFDALNVPEEQQVVLSKQSELDLDDKMTDF